MAWLLAAAAALCFVLAVTLQVGTPVVMLLLLLALGLLGGSAVALLRSRMAAQARDETQMIDAAELRRLREQAEARRRDGVA